MNRQPRDRAGRYDHGYKCDGCGLPVGEYLTDDRICKGSDAPGFLLCDRPGCTKRRDAIEAKGGLEALAAYYAERRAKNDKAHRSRATNRKEVTMTEPTTKPNAPGVDAQAIADLETSARMRRLGEAIESLKLYAVHRIQPGGFLIAVLSNDLMGAVGHADDVSILALGDIARHIYQNLPRACWGSQRAVEAWLNR